MKHILVIGLDMEIGGAERALLGLLSSMDTTQYQVDLFLLKHHGPFMKFIPDNINLLDEIPQYADLGVPIMQVVRKRHWGILLGRSIGKFLAKRYIQRKKITTSNSVEILYSFRYTKPFLPMISCKQYDLAIGFTTPYYVTHEKTLAKNKAVWLHTDYGYVDGDTKSELAAWSRYPHIVSISDAVTKSFVNRFPTLQNRMLQIENIVSPPMILAQSQQFTVYDEMPDEPNVLKLLSIGRFCEAKNFDNIPDIGDRLLKLHCNVKWYLIGYGPDEAYIRKKITEMQMENHVFILGKKENPYPYIKACDFYIQPSRFEGKAVTVREAQILKKPVIITNYPTAYSQLQHEWDGIIVPLDNQGCAAGIAAVIHDSKLISTLQENLKNIDYTNHSEIQKIYHLAEL